MLNTNLNDIENKVTNISLLFLKKNENFEKGYQPLKADIHSKIFKVIKDLFIGPLKNIFTNPCFEEFSYDVSTDGAIQYLPMNDLKGKNIFDVLEKSINNLDSVRPLSDFSKELSQSYLYAFVFELSTGKTFTVVRKICSSNYLKNKGLFTFTDSKLDTVEKDLFALDSKVDCILYDGVVYVTGKYNFENIFSYNTHYIEKANNILTSIDNHKLIENFSEFKADCLDRSSIVKKLAELSSKGSIDSFINKIKSDPNLIHATIQKYHLGTTIKDNRLVYNDISSLSEIINLISENYFESDITHDQYVAKGKNKHIPSKAHPKKRTRAKKKK